jgi:putative ABC transport system ATP-binding protein
MNKVIMKTKDLCKTFVSGKEGFNAIKNVNIGIYEKEFTVIMGSSGSGKSTLLYMLSGMDSITSGDVVFDGVSIRDFKEKNMAKFRRNSIGFVFQAMNLVPDLTIFENIAIPGYLVERNKSKVNEKASKLLSLVEMEDMKSRYPSEVSGGQKQRAAIARALINSPKVIFADEPTGALNSSQGQNILNLLTDLNKKGQTIVMVTHDLKAAVRADRILFIRDGRIDGDLRLERFNEQKREEREKAIFSYLSEKGW